MTDSTTITVRVPVELRDKLDRLAQATERSRSYLAAEALQLYVESELEIVEGILEGIADFEAGRFFTHEQVVALSERMFDEIYEKQAEPMARAVRRKKAGSR